MQLLMTILAMVAGLILIVLAVVRLIKAKQVGDVETDVQHKDGLPITPRDERMSQTATKATPQDDEDTDALSNMAAVAASSPVVNADRTPESPTKASAIYEAPIDQNSTQVSGLDEQVHDLDVPDFQEATELTQPASEQKAPLIDRYLSQEVSSDQNNGPLLNAKDTVTIVITPRNFFTGLPGKSILGLVREYGLKYGVMEMFHRYEHENGTGDLWFSMLGANDAGVQSFDLNTLSESRFNTILLFLSLPHPYALRGFDSMVSTAQMIASDIDADLYDEQGELLNDERLAKLRADIANYQ